MLISKNEICGFVGNVEGVLLIYGCCLMRPFPTPLGPIFVSKKALFFQNMQNLDFFDKSADMNDFD